jgi:hypothetical protein
MVKMGMPADAAKHRMAKEGVDPAILDKVRGRAAASAVSSSSSSSSSSPPPSSSSSSSSSESILTSCQSM